jgi:hypothetical protein
MTLDPREHTDALADMQAEQRASHLEAKAALEPVVEAYALLLFADHCRATRLAECQAAESALGAALNAATQAREALLEAVDTLDRACRNYAWRSGAYEEEIAW